MFWPRKYLTPHRGVAKARHGGMSPPPPQFYEKRGEGAKNRGRKKEKLAKIEKKGKKEGKSGNIGGKRGEGRGRRVPKCKKGMPIQSGCEKDGLQNVQEGCRFERGRGLAPPSFQNPGYAPDNTIWTRAQSTQDFLDTPNWLYVFKNILKNTIQNNINRLTFFYKILNFLLFWIRIKCLLSLHAFSSIDIYLKKRQKKDVFI